jgi:hypothetical protein
MDNNHLKSSELPAIMRLWRKAGVDFDCGVKSTLTQLLELGGFFPLAKVRDRLPISRNCLYQLSRGQGDAELTRCVVPIRVSGKGRAITILVDVVRLNDLLSAQIQGRSAARPTEPQPAGASPSSHQESR